MSDQKSAPDIDPEDIKAAEKAAGIEIVPEDEELPPETAPDEKTADDVVIELEAQLAEVKADRLRAVAEAENTRKRAEREIANVRKYAAEPLARDFLQVSEFIRMALQSVTEEQADADPLLKNLRVGVAMTEKNAVGRLRTQQRQANHSQPRRTLRPQCSRSDIARGRARRDRARPDRANDRGGLPPARSPDKARDRGCRTGFAAR